MIKWKAGVSMQNPFLIVNKAILPDYYEKVVIARNLVDDGMDVSKATKKVGISRSTYYKYKDYIFFPQQDESGGKKAVISILLKHEKGILSEVLNDLSNVNANILSITQSMIVNKKASVEITLDISAMFETIEQVIRRLASTDGVISARLLIVE